MRIRELAAFHVRIPLKKTVRHASHTRSETDSVVVRCRLDSGVEGWGEGLPRPYVTGETIDTALEHFRGTDWPQQLGGSIGGLEDAIARCDRLSVTVPNDPRLRDCFGNSLRCAVEIAVLDAATRESGRPLSDVTLLFAETAAIRGKHDRVRYSAAVTPTGLLPELVRALKYRYYGFHQAKLKVGVAGRSDLAAMRRLRWVLGPSVDLRIDANEAWTCSDLEGRLQALLPYRVSSLEQPVPHAEVDGLAALRGKLGVLLMLDESLCSATDAQRAIERGTCDLFNIRLSKCGGFLPSLRIAAIARRAGLGYQLGCQVGETGILSAAGRHFAASVADIRYHEGSFDRFLVAERLTVEDLTFGRGGWAPALTGPGLGIQIDQSALDRVTVGGESRTLEGA